MNDLDAPATYTDHDSGGMGDLIEGLPAQVADAWEASAPIDLGDAGTPSQVLVLGMGGSAIGGDMLAAVVAAQSPVPVRVIRGYDVPPGLGPETLVVASSNSGSTEETLTALDAVFETGARVVAITRGGTLGAIAEERGLPIYRHDFVSPPRAALGHSLMPLLRIAERVGLVQEADASVVEAVAVMAELRERIRIDVPESDNHAKQLARRVSGKLPVVFGAEHLVPAARRWRAQFAENAKTWAIADELPEADHNTIVGFHRPGWLPERMHAIFLRDPSLHPRVRIRYGLTQQALVDLHVPYDVVETNGSGPLSDILSAVLFGDYVSYYLAMADGVDPTPIEPIDRLKARLAEMED